MPIEITTLDRKSAQEYRDLRLKALKDHPTNFGSLYEEEEKYPVEKWIERIEESPSGFKIFAKDNAKNKLVGMIGAYWTSDRKSYQHVANIWSMYVDKDYQGQGIGSQLMTEMLKRLKIKGLLKIKLGCKVGNESALHLYQKFGFRIVGKLEKEYTINDQFYDEYLMEKLL